MWLGCLLTILMVAVMANNRPSVNTKSIIYMYNFILSSLRVWTLEGIHKRLSLYKVLTHSQRELIQKILIQFHRPWLTQVAITAIKGISIPYLVPPVKSIVSSKCCKCGHSGLLTHTMIFSYATILQQE